jgi:Alr-MurF fusion protein
MDMCMIDISEIAAAEGDEVIIFGQQNPVNELAKQGNTIPYEIIAQLSSRIKRLYYQE